MLSTSDWSYGNIRRYGTANVVRLGFVKAAQRLEFSLDKTADLLALADGSRCQTARAQAALKLADVRRRLTDVRRIEAALQELLERCDASGCTVCCLLIATLQAG